MLNFENGLVKKPWGYEYLMFQNADVGVWFLHIRHEQRTSLHCHPKKNTGLILLSGQAQISFLKDARNLEGLSKLGIRQGTFHSTRALSRDGVFLIEVEHPCQKEDLVRFDDAYGRDENAYESGDAIVPQEKDLVKLPSPEQGKKFGFPLAGCDLTIEKFRDVAALKGRPESEILAFLDGGLVSRSGQYVVNPGDVLDGDTLDRLAQKFDVCAQGAGVLIIRKQTP